MITFTQDQVYHASICLLRPEQLDADHCTIAMMPSQLKFFDVPVLEAEPLIVPFVLVALEPNRQVWAVDLPGLSTLAWVTIAYEIYQTNPDFYLKQAEHLLLDQVRAEMRHAGLGEADWYYFFTWQPIDPCLPGVRNLVLGAYIRTVDHEQPILLVAEIYDGLPVGNPRMN